MQSEYLTLVDQNGMGLYLVDSEAEALEWCESDYGGANVIRPMRVYMAHDLAAAQRDAARYRWLRDYDGEEIGVCTGFDVVDIGASGCASTYGDILGGNELDAYIDDAMRKEGGE